MTFVDKDGDEKLINVPIGMSMLEAAHENDIELEGPLQCFFLLILFWPEPYAVILRFNLLGFMGFLGLTIACFHTKGAYVCM